MSLKREVTTLGLSHQNLPGKLEDRLGPITLTALGNLDLLGPSKTALFCSVRAPGNVILRAHDAIRGMRDEGITVISGFHSPIEKDCLKILLRGKQPIIICLAREIESMRVPANCKIAFDAGRLLFLSPFTKKPKRVTQDSALRRNEVVAALADEAYIPHISPGGQIAKIVDLLKKWHVSFVPI